MADLNKLVAEELKYISKETQDDRDFRAIFQRERLKCIGKDYFPDSMFGVDGQADDVYMTIIKILGATVLGPTLDPQLLRKRYQRINDIIPMNLILVDDPAEISKWSHLPEGVPLLIFRTPGEGSTDYIVNKPLVLSAVQSSYVSMFELRLIEYKNISPKSKSKKSTKSEWVDNIILSYKPSVLSLLLTNDWAEKEIAKLKSFDKKLYEFLKNYDGLRPDLSPQDVEWVVRV